MERQAGKRARQPGERIAHRRQTHKRHNARRHSRWLSTLRFLAPIVLPPLLNYALSHLRI